MLLFWPSHLHITFSDDLETGSPSQHQNQRDANTCNTCNSSNSSLSDGMKSDNHYLNQESNDSERKIGGKDYHHHQDHQQQQQQENSQHHDEQYFSLWVRAMNYLRHVLTEAVTKIATISALNPKRTVALVVLVSFALLGIGFATNFKMDLVADRMYTPKNSIIREHQYWVQEESGFPANPRSLRMIIHQEDGNVMNRESIEGVFEVLDTVRSIPSYEDECAKGGDFEDMNGVQTCRIRSIALFWNNSAEVFREKVSSDVDAMLQSSQEEYPDGSPVDVREIMGLAELHVKTIVESKAFFIEVALPSSSGNLELDSIDSLLDLRDAWAQQEGNPLRLEILGQSSLEIETTRSVVKDIPLVPVVFVMMAGFTCLIFSRRDKVRSRSLLGIGAVVSVFLSLASGYGINFIFGEFISTRSVRYFTSFQQIHSANRQSSSLFSVGVNFTSLTQILPFVVFGIGLDDAFISEFTIRLVWLKIATQRNASVLIYSISFLLQSSYGSLQSNGSSQRRRRSYSRSHEGHWTQYSANHTNDDGCVWPWLYVQTSRFVLAILVCLYYDSVCPLLPNYFLRRFDCAR